MTAKVGVSEVPPLAQAGLRSRAASIAFQIVVVSFASYLLWFWLIRHYPATRLAAFTLLTPVIWAVNRRRE